MPDDALRVALAGFGLAGSAFHAPFIATTPGLRLTAIVTRDAERRERATWEYPEARLVDRLADAWSGGEPPDVVVIAVPNRWHVPLAREALERGAHVVVDKPVAPTAAQTRVLDSLAAEKGRLLVPFHNRRWDGDFRTLRRLVAEGALGDVTRFESRFERWRPQPREGWRELADPEEAGGLLYDLGPHLVDQALVLFGPVTDVYCEMDRRRPGVAVEDDAFVALTHRSGVRSHLWMSVVAAQPAPRFRVLGSRAAYVKWGMDVQEEQLRNGGRPVGDIWGMEPPDQWGTVGAGDDVAKVPTERGDYGGFYSSLVSALRERTPPPVATADAIAGLEVLEAARRSAAERDVVSIARAVPD